MPDQTKQTDSALGVLVDQLTQLHECKLENVGHPEEMDRAGLFAIVPNGKRLESVKKFIDEYRAAPERRRGTATFQDVASFIAHVNAFKNGTTAVFADPDRAHSGAAPKLTAVLDYNPPGSDSKKADWGTHRSIYAATVSDEWKAWTGVSGKLLPQADFAAFLEDRLTDVIVPPSLTADILADEDKALREFADLVGGTLATPNKLLELSRGLSINVETQLREIVTLDTGEIDLKYAEQHRDGEGKPIKVPNLFLIAIPVFYGAHTYRIPVRLRYRNTGGRLAWSCTLVRADRVFDDAFAGICDAVRTETSLPVWLGSPEAPAASV